LCTAKGVACACLKSPKHPKLNYTV
jgi:hypothetical protein